MRRLFSEHAYYSRLYVILLSHNLDAQHIITRLEQNARDISDIFNNYYSNEDSQELYNLLSDHISIEKNIVDMMLKKNNSNSISDIFNRSNTNTMNITNMKDIVSEKEKWYDNVILFSIHLESMNPFLYAKATKELIFEHLDLVEHDTISALSIDHKGDTEYMQLVQDNCIKSADMVHYQLLELADLLAEGIVRQFKRRFDNTRFNRILPV